MTQLIEDQPHTAAVSDSTCPEGEIAASSCNSDGYAKRFECRPDFRLGVM